MTLGIPRFRELIDATTRLKTPCCYVAFPEEVSLELVAKLASTLNETYLKDVIEACAVELLCDGEEARATDRMLLDAQEVCVRAGLVPPLVSPSRYVIRVVLNPRKLEQVHMTSKTVAIAITRQFPNTSMYELLASEQHMPEAVLRVRMRRTHEPDLKIEKQMALLFLKTLSNTVFLTGLRGIKQAKATTVETSVLPETSTESLRSRREAQLQVAGSNLTTLWGLELCDWSRTWTNDVQVTAQVLGIEAAAQQLFHELQRVLSFEGTYVDPRHVADHQNARFRASDLPASEEMYV